MHIELSMMCRTPCEECVEADPYKPHKIFSVNAMIGPDADEQTDAKRATHSL